MFHEYRDIVTKLKTDDAHFARVFNQHNDLHDEIEKAEAGGVSHVDQMHLEKMKKQKLKFKDEAYAMIMNYKQANKI